jgi:hypothetical protein
MMRGDELTLWPARGRAYAVGERLSVVATSAFTKDRVMTHGAGVVEVLAVEPKGTARAVVRHQSGEIVTGMSVLPVAGEPPSADIHPLASQGPDLETKVVWTSDDAISASLNSVVLLAVDAGRGVKAGDEFVLERRAALGDRRVALVRVVRTGPEGSVATVIRQYAAAIAPGLTARRTARMP